MEATRVGSFDNEMYDKLIYENDMPDVEEYWCNRWGHHRKPHRNEDRETRWKPNGITDNREEWRNKHMELLWNSSSYRFYNAVIRN